ncbi:hypothetical protein [Mycolicibacterium vaccae]|jgi:hypothetical protein|uniref:Uncharacterized protein n=1 Tax=Mycolicibacterium vaccae ATCC 25954 TaxID=1194972 RepID=K0UY48_MYCVA|nr:hypothetical protein [Mycolicibacterium vaccae]ANI41617.1 hypothetical protein MYVA_4532 [Mycolicibacterium vaccae 95051]EJZ12062.1 hypothetical protein MVAC_03961 [Mycolicibacterium vaccae ATCC 25954]
MKKSLAAVLIPVGAAVVLAAPAQAETAASTINLLRAQGHDVRISRVGNAPLDQCRVISVRSLPIVKQQFPFDHDDVNVFTFKHRQKVHVALNCSD